MRDNITLRISDMRKLVDGASQELVNLSRCVSAADLACMTNNNFFTTS